MKKEGTCRFLRSDLSEETTSRCFPDGRTLDLNLTEIKRICGGPMPLSQSKPEHFEEYGCTGIHFPELESLDRDDDGLIREKVKAFIASKGRTYLSRRFPDFDHTFVTPVTRRRAPPNNVTLAHVDYSRNLSLEELTEQWGGRWTTMSDFYPDGNEKYRSQSFATTGSFELMGVVTIWICLSKKIQNHALWVASADIPVNLLRQNYHGERSHSMGLLFDQDTQWFYIPDMRRGDAWLFETQSCPHASVDCSDHGGGATRESAEVRVLLLRRRQPKC